ncbi:MAG: universal stress protein [Okeania sp. SIO3C4]|nr:universal stress protein [Okeania sp. SIO3C4]
MGEQRRILAALDASGQGEAIFETALRLAQQQQAQLLLFHCLPLDNQDLSAGSYSDIYGQNLVNFSRALQEQLEEQLEATRKWLTAYSDRAQQAGISTDWDWKVGDPGRRIHERARHWSADLIVVGRRGRTGLAELLMGSVSNYVVHHATCSVMVVQGEQPTLGKDVKIFSVAGSL